MRERQGRSCAPARQRARDRTRVPRATRGTRIHTRGPSSMGAWQVITLAMIPRPLAAEARILSVVERILRQPVLGTELISFGTTASAIALGSQIYSTTTIYAK